MKNNYFTQEITIEISGASESIFRAFGVSLRSPVLPVSFGGGPRAPECSEAYQIADCCGES